MYKLVLRRRRRLPRRCLVLERGKGQAIILCVMKIAQKACRLMMMMPLTSLSQRRGQLRAAGRRRYVYVSFVIFFSDTTSHLSQADSDEDAEISASDDAGSDYGAGKKRKRGGGKKSPKKKATDDDY